MPILCRRAGHLAWLVGLMLTLACASSQRTKQSRASRSPQGSTQLVGKLLGHDGMPMPMAHVTVEGEEATLVAGDGSFSIAIPRGVMLKVSFTGVDHGDHSAHLLADAKPVEVVVKLGTYAAPTPAAPVSLVPIRFAAKGEVSLGTERAMRAESDGVFRVKVPTKAGEFAYEIRGITGESGRSMNGSARTSFRYDGDGNYCNVVLTSGGPLSIEHDPKKTHPPGVATQLLFADPRSKTAQVAAIFDDSAPRLPIATKLAATEAELDALLRQARSIALFASLEQFESETSPALTKLARSSLAQISMTSPLWYAAPTSIVSMTRAAGSEYATKAEELVRHFAADNEQELASTLALQLLISAARDNNEEALARYFLLVTKELKHKQASKLAQLFHPLRSIRAGKSLPSFSLPSADGPETFTNQSFHGKVLLIDFWATWCGPCIEELPNLHATYQEFRDRGFEILSINVDDRIGRSQEMRRRGDFPMPWSNVVLEKGEDASVRRRFEVAGLPTMILVDGTGRILATGPFVRGPRLGIEVRTALAAQKKSAQSTSP